MKANMERIMMGSEELTASILWEFLEDPQRCEAEERG